MMLFYKVTGMFKAPAGADSNISEISLTIRSHGTETAKIAFIEQMSKLGYGQSVFSSIAARLVKN